MKCAFVLFSSNILMCTWLFAAMSALGPKTNFLSRSNIVYIILYPIITVYILNHIYIWIYLYYV